MSVPKLRFKEFSGKWQRKKLGEIFEIRSGTTPFRGTEAFFKNGHHYWIKTTDLNNSLIIETQEKITDLALKETSIKLLPEGTVLVAMYGGFNQIGRTGLLTKTAAINQALSAILPKLDLINPYYLLTYLNYHVEDWKSFAASSRKDPNITKSDVKNFNLTFPSISEQTKIADFLMTVDEKIAQLTQKCELLARYKKGVMQQLFSQKLRFKDDDGRDFPDWEDKQLKDIFTIKYGKDYKHLNSGNIPVIGTGGIMTYVDQFLYDKPSVLIGRKGTIDKPQFIEKP
ncbi:MAG: restriction endonuclease subunit S, partial [Dolichospermum sp.]